MRRTAEVVLTFIGAFVYLIGAFLGGMFTMFEDLLNQQEFVDQVEQTDPSLNPKDIEMVLESASSFGVYILVISIAAIVLGIVSMFLFKGNNKPKAAGIILIVVGGIIHFTYHWLWYLCRNILHHCRYYGSCP
ncbi:DUF4064 domain-containing protein [Gracilibacillus sp. JCM 18860]|uniref:DUF4064 domain-containing protein n=1 Tax=Gracilibacillus sp. JCM 18860 TaxID=1306159 RepID=UPI0006D22BE4